MSNGLTKQGVRDLGNNTRQYRSKPCLYFFGPTEVIGQRSFSWYDYDCEPIFGQRCMRCGETRRS